MVMTGSFDHLGPAFGEAFEKVKKAGYVVRETGECMENYLTNPEKTPDNENKTAIFIPIEDSAKNNFKLSEPERHTFGDTTNRYVSQTGRGKFREVAPKFWQGFFPAVMSQLPPEALGKPGVAGWAEIPMNPDVCLFQGGVLLADPIDPQSVKPPAHVGSLATSGDFVRFTVHGAYCTLERAVPAAVKKARQAGFDIDANGKFWECYCTDPSETPDAENKSLLVLPLKPSTSSSQPQPASQPRAASASAAAAVCEKHTLEGPTEEGIASTASKFVHLSESAPSIGEMAPRMWMKFHSEIMPKLSDDKKEHHEGMWAAHMVGKGDAPCTYRCGVVLQKPVRTAKEKADIPEGAIVGTVCDSRTHLVKWVMSGPFDCLGDAWGEAIEKTKAAGYTIVEDAEAFENYLTDPMTTPYNENKTALYIPITKGSSQTPLKKSRSESKK
jgi:effector-binding domain-containing protein